MVDTGNLYSVSIFTYYRQKRKPVEELGFCFKRDQVPFLTPSLSSWVISGRFLYLSAPWASPLSTAPTPPGFCGIEWHGARAVPIRSLAWGPLGERSTVDAAADRSSSPSSFYRRAIQESLLTSTEGLCPGAMSETSRFDSDLQLAMELSAKELEERELRLREEEAELQQVLQLSLTDK